MLSVIGIELNEEENPGHPWTIVTDQWLHRESSLSVSDGFGVFGRADAIYSVLVAKARPFVLEIVRTMFVHNETRCF